MPQVFDNLNIVITGDSSKAREEIQKASDAIQNMKDADVKLTVDASQAQDAAGKAADALGNVGDAHSEITADASQAQDAAGKAADALENVGDAHAEITADGSQAQDAAGAAQDAINSVQGKDVEINAHFPEQWMNEIDEIMRGTASKISKHFERAAEQSAKSFKDKFKEVADAMDNVSTHFESGFGVVLLGIAAKIGAIASSMGTVITSALAIGGGFEAQMTTVQTISGATGEELEQLTAKAREMGASLPISAKNAAEAMTVLAQRGTSAKDILVSVSDVANLAISQGVDMGTAADLLGSTLTNFSISINDAAKVTAIFNNASNQSALNISKMVEGLKYVGPAASAVGMELTEAMAGMEALANAGLTGEMIGTGLAAVLTKLASKARIAGVETKNLDGSMRPLADIFSELKAKGYSLTEATNDFGVRGNKIALALVKQSEALKQNEENLKDWSSTQAAVDAKAKTFPNTMAAFRSALEELHIEVFDQIKDKAKEAVSGITSLVRVFSEWLSQTKLGHKTVEAFFNGLGFKIPSGADFKKLLDNLDVSIVIEKFRNFGLALKDLGNSILKVKDVIEPPLEFLIDHMETFVSLTFWGWIIDKGLAIPSALIRLSDAFMSFGGALKMMLGLNLTSITAFFGSLISTLCSPMVMGGLGLAALGTGVAVRVLEYRDAQNKLQDALDKEKEFLAEQSKADNALELDVQLNVKTGFEKLPDSWAKASNELRDKANSTVEALREAFKGKVGEAVDAVTAKFPEMADALKNSAEVMSYSSLSQLSKALQGNKEVFDALPEPMKKLVEQLFYMDVRAGQATGSVGNLIIAWKELQAKSSTAAANVGEKINPFTQDLQTALDGIVNSVQENVDRLKGFLGSNDLHLAVDVSLSQAQAQIQELSKSLAEKFNVPTEIVNSVIFTQLQKLAEQGNQTAQSLTNGWTNSANSIDEFMAKAQEAVNYLGASPAKFLPALNNLSKSIQKIDPLTGKLTEGFKKAHDALKQWSNITFNQLVNRIQKLRKAVEGGFIDEKALKAEFEKVSKQVKLQIATEMEPMRGQFQSEEAFNATVASEYFSKMGEIGGVAFMDMVKREFGVMSLEDFGLGDFSKHFKNNLPEISLNVGDASKMMGSFFEKFSLGGEFGKIFNNRSSQKDGAAIGAAIMSEVKKEFGSLKQAPDAQKQNSYTSELLNAQKVFAERASSIIAKLEQLAAKQETPDNTSRQAIQNAIASIQKLTTSVDNYSGYMTSARDAMQNFANALGNSRQTSTTTTRDYTANFNSILTELQNISTGGQARLTAINSLATAISGVEQAVKSQQSSPVDANSITQAITTGITPFLNKLDAQSASYVASTGELARNIVGLDGYIDGLRKSTDTNTSALTSLQNSMGNTQSSGSGESFSAALSPLVSSVQSLATTVSNIQSINQGSETEIAGLASTIKSIESSIKGLGGGNTYNIDFKQEGFVIQRKEDADNVARGTVQALRQGLGNGSV